MSILELHNSSLPAPEELLDGTAVLPDTDSLSIPALEEYRARVNAAIALLDEQEPADQESEEYEDWGDLHEELEDLLDDILDALEG